MPKVVRAVYTSADGEAIHVTDWIEDGEQDTLLSGWASGSGGSATVLGWQESELGAVDLVSNLASIITKLDDIIDKVEDILDKVE